MAENIIPKDQNTQTGSHAQTDVETLLRQSVLLPSQKKAFDRYMAESSNEDQKQEFRDILNAIEQEVLQTYEEYRYTGKPVSEFLKWKDKEIAPLAKVLTGRVHELSDREFGEDEPETDEPSRDLPDEPSDDGAEEKEAAEAEEKAIQEAQEQAANGYTQEENEQWEKSLERREEKQKEWEQFLKNRRDAERQAERDEELFRDHPEYFSDPYQEAADAAEKEAEISSRQYLDAEARAEEERYLRGFSANRQISGGEDGGTGFPGVEIVRKDEGDSSYAGEMLQGMLDGRLDRGSSSGPAKAVDKRSSHAGDSSYEGLVNARTAGRMAQIRAAQAARKNGLSGNAGSGIRGNTGLQGHGSGVSGGSGTGGSPSPYLAGGHNGISAQGGDTGTGGQPVITARKEPGREMTPTGVAAFSGDRLASGRIAVPEETHAADAIRSLKQDKEGIRTQKMTDKEAARQYAERIADAYGHGASSLRASQSRMVVRPDGGMRPDGSMRVDTSHGTHSGQAGGPGGGRIGQGSSVAGSAGAGSGGIRDSTRSGAGRNPASQVVSASSGASSVIRYRVIHGLSENGRALKDKKPGPAAQAAVEDATTQARDAASGRSVIRIVGSGFVKKKQPEIRGKAGGVTDSAGIVGAGGVITPGAGTVAQIGKMAARGTAAGMEKAAQAFREGADGGSGGSSSESKEIQKMQSAARVMRQKIIGAAGHAVGADNGIKTAVNASFRVIQKYSNEVKETQDGEDGKEGTADDPKAVERIWRRNVRKNMAAKKKFPWGRLFGGTASVDAVRRITNAVGGALGLSHPFLILILAVIVLLLVQMGGSVIMHQIDASLPASGRYDMSGEELGDYLDENGNYGSDDDGSGVISSGNTGTTGTWTGAKLTREAGRIVGPSGGEETYYNMNMNGVISIMRGMGNNDRYWVRDDGVKMLGDYVMVAACLSVHPRGSKVETSLGTGIVCDTGGFAADHPQNLDIAVDW